MRIPSRSDVVKIARVFRQDLFHRAFRKFVQVLPGFFHWMYEAFRMRIVRPDKEFIVAGELNDVLEHALLGIATNPDITSKIFSQWPPHLRGVPHISIAMVNTL